MQEVQVGIPLDEEASYNTFILGPDETVMNPADFCVELRNPLMDYNEMRLVSLNFPITHANIQTGRNDGFSVTLGGVTHNYTLTEASYGDMQSLAAHISDVIADNPFGTDVFCETDIGTQKIFFYSGTAASGTAFSIKMTTDLGEILGFDYNTSYVSGTHKIDGTNYDEAVLADHTYDHWGGINNIFIELLEPRPDNNGIDTGIRGMDDKYIIGVVPIAYGESQVNYSQQLAENIVRMTFTQTVVRTIRLKMWGYSGPYASIFAMDFTGVKGMYIMLGFAKSPERDF